MILNLNSEVTVTLTKYGAKIYNKYYKKFYTSSPSFECDAVEEGFVYKTELWHLMQIYGEWLYNGNPDIPFKENKLEISVIR